MGQQWRYYKLFVLMSTYMGITPSCNVLKAYLGDPTNFLKPSVALVGHRLHFVNSGRWLAKSLALHCSILTSQQTPVPQSLKLLSSHKVRGDLRSFIHTYSY